jgi:hypothetical protein
MDKTAYDRLFQYYCHEWTSIINRTLASGKMLQDEILTAFNTMINPDTYRESRERFFLSCKHRIAGISLLKDKVMPWAGVEACMGNKLAGQCFELVDFPYEYTHEFPFPVSGKITDDSLNHSFLKVFQKAAAFLS